MPETPLRQPARGAIDGLRRNEKGGESLVGWARRGSARFAPVIDISADGLPFGTVRAVEPRSPEPDADPAEFGFSLELPPNFGAGETLSFVAAVRTKDGAIEIDRRDLRRAPGGDRLASGAAEIEAGFPPPFDEPQAATCAAIVLTQDGAEILRGLLDSILLFERETFGRIVIIDHDSSDDTASVIASFADRLPLQAIRRPRHSSFSESNNIGAAACTEDVLVFVNNDIVLTEPVVAGLAAHLGPDVGLVGLRLMDPPIPHSAHQAPQHVGIHFGATPDGIRPFESRRLTDLPAGDSVAIETPAVTAALTAMRRAIFQRLGGFDEGYFFGWEDADLCLKSLFAGFRNVCLNSLAAVHLGSHTRRRMPPELKRRRAANEARFAARWSYALKRRFGADLFARPGYWTGRKLHIGFAMSGAAADRASAESLALAWSAALPVKAFLLPDRPAAADIDVLVVGRPDLDIGAVPGLSSAAWVVAWVGGDLDIWSAVAWREEVDIWLGASEKTARTLTKLTGRPAVCIPFRKDGEQARASAGAVAVALRTRAAQGLRLRLHVDSVDTLDSDRLLPLRTELERLGHTVRIAWPLAIPSRPERDHIAVHFSAASAPVARSGLIDILWASGRASEIGDAARASFGWVFAAPAPLDRLETPRDLRAAAVAFDTGLRRLDAEFMTGPAMSRDGGPIML